MKRRLLGLILVIVLSLSLFPLGVSAETITKKIGENVYFEYNTVSKVLRIYGSGKYDPTYAIAERISDYKSIRLDMETLIFEEGITYVPSMDFSMSMSLKEIHLADTVEILEEKAFYSSEVLEKVTGGQGLKHIEDSAFKDCEKLQGITIPNDTIVAPNAFSGCPILKINRVDNTTKSEMLLYNSHKNTEFVKLRNYLVKNGTTENNITAVTNTVYDDTSFTLFYDIDADKIGLRTNVSAKEYGMISELSWDGESEMLDLLVFYSTYSNGIIQVGMTSVLTSEIRNNDYKFDKVIIDVLNADGESILQQGSEELLASTKQAFINLFPTSIAMIRNGFTHFLISEVDNILIDDQKLGFSTSLVPRVTLYTEDGRSAEFDRTQIEAQLAVGWYTEPVQRLYAVGKSKAFEKSKVEAQLKVGWYTEPVVNMYALDGRVRVTKSSEVEAYKKVGWYTEPMVKMYALDGRTRVTKKSEIEAYEKVGWYYGTPVKMYALDGRTKWVGENRVVANEKVGWYYGEPTKMYASDGRIITIGKNRVQEYKNVGWYTTKSEADAKAEAIKKSEKTKQDDVIRAVEYISTAVDHISTGGNSFKVGLEKVYSNFNSHNSEYTFYNPTYIHMQAIYGYALVARSEYKKAQEDLKASYNIFSQYSEFDKVSTSIQQALTPINNFVSKELSTSNALDEASTMYNSSNTVIQHLKTAVTYLEELGY